jgi:hypothetical protein
VGGNGGNSVSVVSAQYKRFNVDGNGGKYVSGLL